MDQNDVSVPPAESSRRISEKRRFYHESEHMDKTPQKRPRSHDLLTLSCRLHENKQRFVNTVCCLHKKCHDLLTLLLAYTRKPRLVDTVFCLHQKKTMIC